MLYIFLRYIKHPVADTLIVTLFFSKRLAKQRRNDEEMLQQELCNLQRKMGLDPSEENVSKFYNVRFILNQISLLKTKYTK